MRIILTIITVLAVASCGSPHDLNSAGLSADGADASEVRIAMGEANPGALDEYKLLVSFPTKPEAAAICEFKNEACVVGSEIQIAHAKTVGLREIYLAQNFSRIDGTASLAITYKIAGVVKARKFRFTANGVLEGTAATSGGLKWKALIATGDNEFRAWDNARVKIGEFLTSRGITSNNMRQLSMTSSLQKNGVGATSQTEILNSLKSLTATDATNEACLVFLTSHGSPQGFFLRNQGTLAPATFSKYLSDTCGNRPTVAIVSACYSGVMIEGVTIKPNQIILTAARKDRTSFGCDAASTYTFFDECVIETLPKAKTWFEFEKINTACVNALETQRGITNFSYPQAKFGSKEMESLQLPQ